MDSLAVLPPPSCRTLAVSRASSRSEARAEAVGVGSSALLGAAWVRHPALGVPRSCPPAGRGPASGLSGDSPRMTAPGQGDHAPTRTAPGPTATREAWGPPWQTPSASCGTRRAPGSRPSDSQGGQHDRGSWLMGPVAWRWARVPTPSAPSPGRRAPPCHQQPARAVARAADHTPPRRLATARHVRPVCAWHGAPWVRRPRRRAGAGPCGPCQPHPQQSRRRRHVLHASGFPSRRGGWRSLTAGWCRARTTRLRAPGTRRGRRRRRLAPWAVRHWTLVACPRGLMTGDHPRPVAPHQVEGRSPPSGHTSLPPGFSSPGGAPNARGEPRQQPERGTSGGCWRRLQCVVRCSTGIDCALAASKPWSVTPHDVRDFPSLPAIPPRV